MRALVTGASGTVGSALCGRLLAAGHQPIGWNRELAPPGDWDATCRLFDEVRPEVVYHNALPSTPTGRDNEGWVVNEKWTADISARSRDWGIPFVYTSTVMVFSNRAKGPFTPESVPDETEGYGFSKLSGERMAQGANAHARIARIGWQIGSRPEGNNMLFHLKAQHDQNGEITASTRWLPATSFLEDTADALIAVSRSAPGIYHLGANDRWSFFQIASALSALHGFGWKVRATEDFVYDQRLEDQRIRLKPIEERLPGLA